MKTVVVRGLVVVVCVLFTTLCNAQTITIKNVTMQPMDMTASQHPVLDINGDTCALIKIKTDHLEGLEFTNKNQYVKANYQDGIYFIYVPSATGRKIDFMHKDYLSGTIDMREYGYKRLKGGKTYMVIVEAPIKSELKSTVILKVEPENANVVFNDKTYEHKSGGTYTFSVEPGNYRYLVSLVDYLSKSDVVSVGKSEAKTVTVKLQPHTHLVNVSGNVKNARVLVDNIDYGKVGKINLPQGSHNIRIIADGYNDQTMSMVINANTSHIHFSLEKNKMVEHIHATPVTIYSSGTKVYKDNKEIKEWKFSGDTVYLMPGKKYMLSDNADGKFKIKVGNEPLKVRLGK